MVNSLSEYSVYSVVNSLNPVIRSKKMKNKYLFHAHITEQKFRQVMRYFALDIEISKISILTGVSRQSLNGIIFALRQRIAGLCDTETPPASDISNPVAVGIYKEEGFIRTRCIGISAMPDLIVLRSKWSVPEIFQPYDGVINVSTWKYHQISPVINDAAAFWGLTKERLARFRGLHRKMIYYHLKESEYRYNHRHEDLYPVLLNLCSNPALRLM